MAGWANMNALNTSFAIEDAQGVAVDHADFIQSDLTGFPLLEPTAVFDESAELQAGETYTLFIGGLDHFNWAASLTSTNDFLSDSIASVFEYQINDVPQATPGLAPAFQITGTAVPEPTTASLMALGAIAVLRRRR